MRVLFIWKVEAHRRLVQLLSAYKHTESVQIAFYQSCTMIVVDCSYAASIFIYATTKARPQRHAIIAFIVCCLFSHNVNAKPSRMSPS
jgi:hypothetical protein